MSGARPSATMPAGQEKPVAAIANGDTAMADVPVEVKKATPATTPMPDVWRSFRSEMDRLFDRFGFPSLRRMFDYEPACQSMSGLGASTPPIDISEDEKSYKISAELAGLDAKDVDVSVSDGAFVLKGEKRQEKEQKDENYYFSERSYGAFQRAFELPASVARQDRRRLCQERADDHFA
jgi:HSP20 family protein